MSLQTAVLWAIASTLWHVGVGGSSAGIFKPVPLQAGDLISLFGIGGSLALFAFTRKTDREPKFILNLGLVYMVFLSLGIGLINHWEVMKMGMTHTFSPQISWIGVVVLIFAAVTPMSTRKTVIAGLIAVSMNPLGMFVATLRGSDFGSWTNSFLMHYPDYLLVGVAVVIARVVMRLGQQVSKAREMGSYQLGDLLKRGGMGEVYKATHRMLARPAAIKLIRPEMLGAAGSEDAQLAVKRFHREAEAAANLRSPHTVELFDFGVTEDQTLYFVMELLDGMDLESLVRKHGAMPAARAIHILRQACLSLEEAHAQGLVHRDIKPANIHIGRLGIQHDFVKVLDFGLVKSVTSSSEVSLGTAVGRTPGTPAYMAPEMALGETVDGRSDLYALGCVAYYLLTGKLVFDAENTFQMVAKHLHHVPEPPSVRGGVEVPAELERLVLACLAKKPGERPADAGELERSLASIDVRPIWSETDAREWWSVNQ
ncbi:MAG: serine/threonine-protein kinase [Gemmatimonadales bacterium]